MLQTQNLSPEEWLKECYEELHSIFISFDGSMMISAVVGMIDNETGLMYYFNAEHPWTILLRNNKAKFTEQDLTIRKIGTVDLDKGVVIKVLQLEPGDIVVMGSDGRDDIAIGTDSETGLKIMNEDESLFLNIVERSGGDIKTIVDEINKNGEITDDLSLIRIAFKSSENVSKNQISQKFYDLKDKGKQLFSQNKFQEAVDYFEKALEITQNEEVYELLYQCYQKLGKIEEELKVLEKASLYYPTHSQFLYRTSIIYKKLKKYDLAITYGERYAIFWNDHLNNLINLSDSYRLNKNYHQARAVLEKAEKIDPKNENVYKLNKILMKELES